MTSLQQELAQLQPEFDDLIDAWNALSRIERRRQWMRYLDLTDEGGAGWHRFALLLINSFCEGWCPLEGMGRSAHGEIGPTELAAA